jgi:hypothetical protein
VKCGCLRDRRDERKSLCCLPSRLQLRDASGGRESSRHWRSVVPRKQIRLWFGTLRRRGDSVGAHRRRHQGRREGSWDLLSCEFRMDEIHCYRKAVPGKPTVRVDICKVPVTKAQSFSHPRHLQTKSYTKGLARFAPDLHLTVSNPT